MLAALFAGMTQIRVTHVPYKGAPQGRVAVMAHECDFMFDGLLAALPLIKGGRLRGLGVTGVKRSAAAPEIPTIAEAGVPGYSGDAWYGLFAPRGITAGGGGAFECGDWAIAANGCAPRTLARAGGGGGRQHAGYVRRLSQSGNREVGTGGERRRYQDGLAGLAYQPALLVLTGAGCVVTDHACVQARGKNHRTEDCYQRGCTTRRIFRCDMVEMQFRRYFAGAQKQQG